jgi:murein L,D-transpeptidase YafK
VILLRIKLLLGAALLLTACGRGDADTPAKPALVKLPTTASKTELPKIAAGVKADKIVVDKSDRTLILYKGGAEIGRYSNIRLGDAPAGHKQFEGDEKTPEGTYRISGRNPGSSYHRSLRISYPSRADIAYAKSKGKSPGGDIFIHGQPNRWAGPTIARDWTDGCIALSNAEIEQLWRIVPDGISIKIQP